MRERDGVLVLAVSQVVSDVHGWWGWVVIVLNAFAGAWALGAHARPELRVPALWWVTAVAEVAIFVQVILGVVLVQGRNPDDYGFHLLYGFTAAFSVAIVFSYRNQLADKKYLLYGFGGLFIAGLCLRAITTLP